jgi:hypothetical protein
MLYHYQRLCIVNPHFLESSEIIDQHFCSGLPSKEHLGHHSNVESSIISILAFINDLDYGSVRTLDLSDEHHQRMFKWVLKSYSDSLSFLLQNGTVYKYQELQKMFINGEFQKITGGATLVTFSEYEHCSLI